jgi:hypothetical protein
MVIGCIERGKGIAGCGGQIFAEILEPELVEANPMNRGGHGDTEGSLNYLCSSFPLWFKRFL